MKELCFSKADILLPKENLERFSVIACDQFTSEPEYWESVKDFTAGYPTALDLILPEIYLKDDNTDNIERIGAKMEEYLNSGVFKTVKNSFIFTKRVQSDGILRTGIIGKIDLKEYSYRDDGKGEVRSTEKTVLSRIPPRADIRRGAQLELPHIMLFFDDKKDAVMRYLLENEQNFERLYDFTLFSHSGKISGYRLDEVAGQKVKEFLNCIMMENNGLLFCVGDGNHSLAAAKSIYEQSEDEKDRYALVEIVNIHSPAINFEPIYRVLFGIEPETVISEFKDYCDKKGGKYRHIFKCVYSGAEKEISVPSDFTLPVAALQNFLDSNKKDVQIDYIHGIESTKKIAKASCDRLGFIFDGMDKEDLFKAVINDGSLPRKTFSMGHALDKRFYLEAREIK